MLSTIGSFYAGATYAPMFFFLHTGRRICIEVMQNAMLMIFGAIFFPVLRFDSPNWWTICMIKDR